jgi:aryl-alcohol dehydrogenase-like predicted oxidoreductase
LLDTADEYGAGQNEQLLGNALAGRRHRAFVATKFGFVWDQYGKATGLNAKPEYARRACEASLGRLRTDSIDLYYLHRVDPQVPIEDTVGAMARLVEDGKVRYLGLSEVTPELVRRASAVHRITALQSEYSLWTRDPEGAVLPLCGELGIAFVSFSPLGRGFFSGKLSPENIKSDDFRRQLPRFQPENFALNSQRLSRLQKIAEEKQCTPAQLALAWVLASGANVLAIPGSKSIAHLEENLGAVSVRLSEREKSAMDEAFQPGTFAGERYPTRSLFRPD